MLDRHAGFDNIRKPLCVFRTEQLLCNRAGGMHSGDILRWNMMPDALHSIDVSAFADLFATIGAFTVVKQISGEHGFPVFGEQRVFWIYVPLQPKVPDALFRNLRIDGAGVAHVAVIELILRRAVRAEYKPGRVAVGRVIYRKAGKVGQDLPGNPVFLPCIENGFCRNNVVLTVVRDHLPFFLRHRLIPRKAEFLMMDPQFDLPLLQALLLAAEVINIRVRDPIGVPKHGVLAAADDPLAQFIEFLDRISNVAGIQHVVVVPAAVEPNQPHMHQVLDVLRSRIHKSHNRLVFACKLVADEEQIRKDFHIEEDKRNIKLRGTLRIFVCRIDLTVMFHMKFQLLFTLPLHLETLPKTGIRLMGAALGKGCDSRPHVRHVVLNAGSIGVVQHLQYEVDFRLCRAMMLLSHTGSDAVSQLLFAFNALKINNLFLL